MTDVARLDQLTNPVLAALTGPQAHLAVVEGSARRFPTDVSPFFAMPDDPTGADWDSALQLLRRTGAGGLVAPQRPAVPGSIEVVQTFSALQMVDDGVSALDDPDVIELTEADLPDMLDLADRTKPGPFLAGTPTMGRYLGVRRDGALAAMAGERVRPPGLTEISAVCTDPRFRGQGLAERLVRAVLQGIHRRGDRAFLHVLDTNRSAIQLYERLGFAVWQNVVITVLQAPS